MLGKVLGFPLLFSLNVTETRCDPSIIIIHSLELYERPISAVPFLLTGTSESRSDNDYKIKQSDTAISLMLLPSPPPPSLNGAGGSIFVALSVSSKGHSPVQSIVVHFPWFSPVNVPDSHGAFINRCQSKSLSRRKANELVGHQVDW